MTTSDAQQQAFVDAEPQKEHQWLQKLVGDWTYEGDPMEPGQPPFTGTETVRSLDGIWFVAEGRGDMPGAGPTTTLMTLGFDPQRKRFVGTWIGSMMTFLWVYEGELDPSETTLTLNCEGPHMTDPSRIAQYKDVIEFKNDDHRVLTAHTLGGDGNWQHFMTTEYRRAR